MKPNMWDLPADELNLNELTQSQPEMEPDLENQESQSEEMPDLELTTIPAPEPIPIKMPEPASIPSLETNKAIERIELMTQTHLEKMSKATDLWLADMKKDQFRKDLLATALEQHHTISMRAVSKATDGIEQIRDLAKSEIKQMAKQSSLEMKALAKEILTVMIKEQQKQKTQEKLMIGLIALSLIVSLFSLVF